MNRKIFSLDPILPNQAKVLILGSIPSEISLEHCQYYGNARNHFWPIMFEIFRQPPINSYEDKVMFIKKHGIALWDTIGACYRKGSLDKDISSEEPNDILGLLERHPEISLIACNGTKSYQTFKKYITLDQSMSIDVIKLPSSSPIPGRYTKTFEGKVEEWKRILHYM